MIELTPDLLNRMPLPDAQGGDKKARGSVLVIGGSVQVPGAALLAGTGALRAGAGRLRIATCRGQATALGISVPEALVLGLDETAAGGIASSGIEDLLLVAGAANAVLIGPGLADQNAIDALATAMLGRTASGPGFVFDARAIQSLRGAGARLAPHAGRLVITPHGGEMAGLLGEERSTIEADPEHWAREAARLYGVTVVLKGAATFVIGAGREGYVWRKGNIGLATSGSGDVLAGIVAGLLARGASPLAAACWGVSLHALAGDRLARSIGPLGFLAREIPGEIPRLLHDMRPGP